MKKQIWLAAGIAGMLLGSPAAQAEVNVRIGERGDRPPSFMFDRRPNFLNIPNLGFSVSIGSSEDIISYGNRYYINHNGRWYVAYNYRGPWMLVREGKLPRQIRRHRWDDIRNFRDVEYRRHDRRNHRDQNNDGGRGPNDGGRGSNDGGRGPNDGGRGPNDDGRGPNDGGRGPNDGGRRN